MTKLTLAQKLAKFAFITEYDSLSYEVVEDIKSRILDLTGICLAASSLDTSQAAMEWVTMTGGHPQATAFGVSEKVPASSAAFVNGVLAHSLDYDDTHLPSVLHPSAPVIPAALAVAERFNSSTKDLIVAIALGIEVCVRLGMAGYDNESKSSTFFNNGQHATSITGAMGASVAVAKLMNFTEKQIVDTLGLTASMASGVIEANRTGGTVKRMHCGWAAKSAVSAGELVNLGFSGPPTVLEGRFGFFHAWLHGKFDDKAIKDDLGVEWSSPKIFFKPYPANHFTHSAIDAALQLRADGVKLEDIAAIEFQTASATLRTIGEPLEVKRAPETGYMAQFSAPYVIAAAIKGGGGLGLGLDDFTDEKVKDAEIQEAMQKINVTASAECDEIFPHQFPGILILKTNTGQTVVKKVLTNRGGPNFPLSPQELGTKFSDNSKRVLGEQDIVFLKKTINNLENNDVQTLFSVNKNLIASLERLKQ